MKNANATELINTLHDAAEAVRSRNDKIVKNTPVWLEDIKWAREQEEK